MSTQVERWLERRTSTAADWSLDMLRHAKGDTTITVILPALNEQETVGGIVRAVRQGLMSGDRPMVDRLVVLDSGSTDATAHVAAGEGAEVLTRDEILPGLPTVDGKGEAMWRALAATDGDVVVFIDADLRSFTAGYVCGLLGPLLTDPSVHLSKAVYERPLVQGEAIVPAGGGRVTELLARPLLNLYWPELAGVIQPLAGEYAARRGLLEQLTFPVGYGVEFAILVDTAELMGVDAIAQVDLGVRVHRHHDERMLGRMAAQIIQTAMRRLDGNARDPRQVGHSMAQFARVDERFISTWYPLFDVERPALRVAPVEMWT